MSDPLRTYNFMPWLQRGLSRRIPTVDPLGPQGGNQPRAQVDVDFDVLTRSIGKPVSLIGPGDITGINPRAIVKTEPRSWITNFEPNYLAFVEFYDEDFAWRYTPARANAQHRLRPWICLVALADDEYEEIAAAESATGVNTGAIRLKVPSDRVLPPADQVWAWAHVHVSEDVSNGGSRSVGQTVTELGNLIGRNPDQASCRLLCARKLKPNTRYTAMVLPAFEVGRLGGLGQDPGALDGLKPAWGDGQDLFPVLYKWQFRTAERGDFEYLVGLLEPGPVPDDVGSRPMDMQQPGFGIPGLASQPTMGLEGALRKPGATPAPTEWPPQAPLPDFLTKLTELVNVPAEQMGDAAQPDPVVSIPLYGRWHAMVDRLDLEASGWTHALNRDPRLRVASGFGSRVIRKGQESYMKRAWQQVGDVIEANRLARLAQFAIPAGYQIYLNNILTLQTDQVIGITAALHARIMGSPTTIRHQISRSRLPAAALTPRFRAITRPRGRVMRRVVRNHDKRPANMLTRLNDGDITAAAPKSTPAGQSSLGDLSRDLTGSIPKWLGWLLRRPWLLLVLAIFLVLLLGWLSTWAGVAGIAGAAALLPVLRTLRRRVIQADAVDETGINETTIANAPGRPDFEVLEPGAAPAAATTTGEDNDVAARFRLAAGQLAERIALRPEPEPPRESVSFDNVRAKVTAAINPAITVPQRLAHTTNLLGDYEPLRPAETIHEAMAHPSFPDPMYKQLRDLSPDHLVPNLNKIPNNRVSLLESNREFIESYMVGLNHEMARELLWRKYPTDQRGSYFRQFWDVSETSVPDPGESASEREERLKDITRLHTWGRLSRLGRHENRDVPTGAEPGEARLVLVVRGDLFKKYPTTVVFAQKAIWVREDPGDPRSRQIRVLDDSAAAAAVELPIFKAEIEPDIQFFGFNLTASMVRGSTEPDDGDPGWFFVLQERPGEPRFGLDVAIGTPPVVDDWSKLAWDHLGNIDEIEAVDLGNAPATSIPAANPDRGIAWGSNAADMAYILYQDPAMVAFHAADMLD